MSSLNEVFEHSLQRNQETDPSHRRETSSRHEIPYTLLTPNNVCNLNLDKPLTTDDNDNDSDDTWGSEFDESSEEETKHVNLSQEEKDNNFNTLIEAQIAQCRPLGRRNHRHHDREPTALIAGNVSLLVEKFKSKFGNITPPITNQSGEDSANSNSASSFHCTSQNFSTLPPDPSVRPSAPPLEAEIAINQHPTHLTATGSTTGNAVGNVASFVEVTSSKPQVLPKPNNPISSRNIQQPLPYPPIVSPNSSHLHSGIYPQIPSYLQKNTPSTSAENTIVQQQKKPSIAVPSRTATSAEESPSPLLPPRAVTSAKESPSPPPLPSRPPPPLNRFVEKITETNSLPIAAADSASVRSTSAPNGVKKKSDASVNRDATTRLKSQFEGKKNAKNEVIQTSASPLKLWSVTKKSKNKAAIRAVTTILSKPELPMKKNDVATVIRTVTTPLKPQTPLKKDVKTTSIQTAISPSLESVETTLEGDLGPPSGSPIHRLPLPPPLPKRVPFLTPELAKLAAAYSTSVQKTAPQDDPDNVSLTSYKEEKPIVSENVEISENPADEDYLPPRKDSKSSVKRIEGIFSSNVNQMSLEKKGKYHSPERPVLPEKRSTYQRSTSLTSLVANSIIGNKTSKHKNLIAKISDRKKSSEEPTTLPLRISSPIIVKTGNDINKMTLTPIPTAHVETEQPSQDNLSQRPWYHEAEWKEAKRRLISMKYDGAFLVRPCSRFHEGIPYVICVNYQGQVLNLQIRCKADGSYALGMEKSEEKTFSSVDKLIRFYQTTPLKLQLPESTSESFVRLLVTPPKE